MSRAPFAIILAILVLCGCGEAGAGDRGHTVRDSAGVAIVENSAPAWSDDERWTIDPEPAVEIGMLDGPVEYQLDRVGVARRLPDGRIAVTNGGTEIRFYDPEGMYLRTVGRQGDGPGEFQGLFRLFATSDSLFAWDARPRRISVFDGSGRFVRSTTLAVLEGAGFPQIAGRFGDGSYVATVSEAFGPGGVSDGLSRRPLVVVRYDAEGTMLDTLGVTPGYESFVQTQEGGFTVTSLLFGRGPVTAVSEEAAVLGGNDAYQLERYRPDGSLARIVRRRAEPRPVTDADWNALRDERLDGAEADWRPRIEAMIASMPRPQTMPFYSSALLDDEENLWVADFRAPADPEARWSVFEAEGRWLGTVALPERFRPTHIGSDRMLGVWLDDLDVQHVRVHRIVKP
jgi:hypothetical protein